MAYGTNGPFGLRPCSYLNGNTWNNQLSDYLIGSTYNNSIFSGDPVIGLANGTIGVAAAGVGNPILGVFWGCQYTDLNGFIVRSPYWPANTATKNGLPATAFIIDDYNVLFDIQADNTLANGFVAADLNNGSNILFNTAGSTISGLSGATAGAVDNTANAQLKIIRFTPDPRNAPGIRNNNVLVLINNDIYKGGTGTAGV